MKAKVDLYEKGYIPLSPETEHAPFDLAIFREGERIRTVQVKYRKVNSRGALDIAFKSSWTDKNGTHDVPVDKENIDLYCVYCPDTDKCYYFDAKNFGKSLTLRVEAPKNNQKSGVKLASDYCEVP